jgi:hypothetical protein
MAHLLVSRSLSAELQSFGGYRFGRVKAEPTRGAPHRFGSAFRRAIKAIVDSKLRRMERELELLGIRTGEPG